MSAYVELVSWRGEIAVSLIEKWRECIHTSNNFRAALQTPEWVDYRWRPSANTLIATLHDSRSGNVTGLTPLAEHRYPLSFSVGGQKLGKLRLAGLLLLGNEPLVRASFAAHDALVSGILARPGVDSLQIQGVRKESPFWSFLKDAQKIHQEWIFYTPEQPSHRYWWIDMPHSYEEYVKQFSSKERYNLKRELALLERQIGGKLELLRITDPERVPDFLSASHQIAAQSWQREWVGQRFEQGAARQELLEGMARRAMLRGYLLKVGQQPCAYVIGFQLQGIFYFYETAYDKALAKFSPGKSLVQLILRDLFDVDTPRIFYFGPGDARYKKWFANRSGEEVTLLIVKKRPATIAKILAHRLFRKIVEAVKGTQTAISDKLTDAVALAAPRLGSNPPV